ncbi:MAG TPA: type II toxin-antitoxin system VapC family toxin [Terriglobia bacterium]|nr:type II toxin-antitoxin system VapC family toxin [Terriglobia bacterium]
MKLLLDTHIWLWSVLAPERLSSRVRRALRDRRNELWLSPISVWELAVLSAKGRVVLNEDAKDWALKAISAGPLREATLTHDIALETANLQMPHRDPADYFLAATARVLDLTLVTADKRLIESRQCPVLANP